MKKLFTFIYCFLLSTSLWAEAPQTISYQAVVRNDEGRLMQEKPIGVRVSILQESESGTVVYSETRTVTTNTNGLITFAIGDENASTSDTLANIAWADNTYFLRCEMDPEGGSNYTLSSTSQMNSVPYALYAKHISPEALPTWAQSEDKPVYNYTEIEGAPTKVSELENDAFYITKSDSILVTRQEADSLYQSKGDYLTSHQSLADYAKRSELPKADSLLSKYEASTTYQVKGNYLTDHQSLAEYAKKNELPKADSLLSKYEASTTYQIKGNYLTDHQSLAEYAKKNELPKADSLLSKYEASTTYQIKGNYLTDHQSLAEYAKRSELPKADSLLSKTEASTTYQPKGNYLTDHQSLAEYAKKSDIPTVPSNVSAFKNDADYAMRSDLPKVPTNVSSFVNDAGYITSKDVITGSIPSKISAFENDANYAKISDIPTKVSLLTNDAGYAKKRDIPTMVSELTNDAGYAKKSEIPTKVSYFINDANYAKKSDLPTVPTYVSAFKNDANYATIYDLPKADSLLSKTEASTTYQKKGDYLTSHQSLEGYAKKSDIPTVPSNVGAFKNDAGYITAKEVPSVSVPTKVSAFANDANYATIYDLPKADSLLSKTEASTTYQKKGNYLTSHQSLEGYAKKTDIPTVPTKVSQLTNDSKYITAAAIPTKVSAFTNDANYAKKSDIPTVPSNVGAFKNDAGYITAKEVPAVAVPTKVSAFENDANYATKSELPKKDSLLSKVEASKTYQTKGNYLTSHQSLTEYAKKSDLPTIPTNVSTFKNDAGYITAKEVPSVAVPTNVSYFKNDAGYITAKEVPSIAVPTKVSAFENDANYATKSELPKKDSLLSKAEASTTYQKKGNYLTSHQSLTDYAKKSDLPTKVSQLTNDSKYITSAAIPTKVSAFTNDANYAKKSELPTIPTNVSTFKNDAGYITAKEVPACTVPTKVSAFENDANYIKKADIPTKVSTFTNDANYITMASFQSVISQYGSVLEQYQKTMDSLKTVMEKEKKELDSLKNVVKNVENSSTVKSYVVSLTASPTAGGTVTGAGTYNNGTSVIIKATPATGYSFSKWSDGNTSASRTITVTAATSLTASFVKNSYTVSLTASPTAGGTVTGAGSYEYGTSATIKATPATGYSFSKWSDGNTSASRTITVTAAKSLTASFVKNSYTVSLTASPTAGGTVTGAGSYEYGVQIDINATPATGYSFSKWSDDNTSAFRKITVTAAKSLTASFVKNSYTVSLTASPTAGGTVTGAGSYEYGTSATIKATPATGYSFSKWSDGNTSASRTITVTAAKSLTASFVKNSYTVSLTASPTAGGTVTGAGSYEYGASATIKATPATGYSFSKWSDGNTSASRTITVTAATSLTATFEKDAIADVDSYKWFYTTYKYPITKGLTLMDKSGNKVTGDGTIEYESGKEYTIISSTNKDIVIPYAKGEVDLTPLKDVIETYNTAEYFQFFENHGYADYYASGCSKLKSAYFFHAKNKVEALGCPLTRVIITGNNQTFKTINIDKLSNVTFFTLACYGGDQEFSISGSKDTYEWFYIDDCPNLTSFNAAGGDKNIIRVNNEANKYPDYIRVGACPKIEHISGWSNAAEVSTKVRILDMENLTKITNCINTHGDYYDVYVGELYIENCPKINFNNLKIKSKFKVDLNDEWEEDTEENTDPTNYNCYRSHSNHNKDGETATMNFTNDGSTITFYVRGYSDGESCYDYVTVKTEDGTRLTRTKCDSDWVEVSTDYDGKIFVEYAKDSGGDDGNDRGYLMLPK